MRNPYARYVRFRTPAAWTSIYPVHVELSAVHWGAAPHTEDGVKHAAAPRAWPWWRLFKLSVVRLGSNPRPETYIGRRLWVYTRWGTLHADLIIDRRD